MGTRVWLSCDLQVRGDYENLYVWLDQHDAQECVDNSATFVWNATNPARIKEEIKDSLIEVVRFDKRDRVYLIFKKEDGDYSGSFIIGKRKANPWTGYGQVDSADDE
jgi:hypothetical protein